MYWYTKIYWHQPHLLALNIREKKHVPCGACNHHTGDAGKGVQPLSCYII